MPIVLPSVHLILPKESSHIGQLQSSLMLFISSWLPREGLTKPHMSTISKLIYMQKNPWVEHTAAMFELNMTIQPLNLFFQGPR